MRALHEVPGDLHGTCGGRDQVDPACKCPDPVLELRVHAYSGTVIGRKWTCTCCRLPINWAQRELPTP